MAEETFAERLESAMAESGLKQVDLIREADNLGRKLGKSQISQYLSGKTIPRPSMMSLLATLLGVSEEWLAADAYERSGAGAGPALADGAPHAAGRQASTVAASGASAASDKTKGTHMRKFTKSHKLDNVLYDVRGPVVEEANRMEENGTQVLKLNIGNPAPFGFRTPDEVIYDMRRQLIAGSSRHARPSCSTTRSRASRTSR